MSYMNSVDNRIRRSRIRSGVESRNNGSKSPYFPSLQTLLEKCAGRVVLENRVAPTSGLPPTARRDASRTGYQEGRARAHRRQPRQLNLRDDRTARARTPRAPSSRHGRFALTSCESSTAANPAPEATVSGSDAWAKRLNHRMRLPSSGAMNRASALWPRPFLCFQALVRRLRHIDLHERFPTKLNGRLASGGWNVSKTA